MSYRFYFLLAGCSRVNILKPADNLKLSLLGTGIQLKLHSNQIPKRHVRFKIYKHLVARGYDNF
jgi:hypothetical protein